MTRFGIAADIRCVHSVMVRWLALWTTLLFACDGALVIPRSGTDAGVRPDGRMDGSTTQNGMDSSIPDSSMPDSSLSDAYVPPRTDAGPYIGTPCSVAGVSGTCEDVTTCTGTSTAGYCPGPANIQCCTTPIDPGGSCDPSVMPTPNDGLSEVLLDVECPDGMVRVASFCIDRYEASLVLLDAAGAPVASWSPYHNPGSRRMRAMSIQGAIPQGYINGVQAANACREAAKRLCTDTEWLRACRGPSSYTFPYGNTREPDRCNDSRANDTHPAVERFGTSADWIWSSLGDACINQLPDSLASSGAHTGCETAEGVFDMMGNLHEWTADPAGTFRGGFYFDWWRNGEGCLYATTAHNTSHWDYSTGFRCCADLP